MRKRRMKWYLAMAAAMPFGTITCNIPDLLISLEDFADVVYDDAVFVDVIGGCCDSTFGVDFIF